MRLTTVILIAALMQVHAAGLAQKINLSKSKAPLKTVLTELRVQSGYNFIYTDDLLQLARPVDIKVNDADFEEVLKEIFAVQPLTYSMNKNTITVQEKKPAFLERLAHRWAGIDASGRVMDSENHPLAGANVKVKRTERAVSTDVNGKFILKGVEEGDLLIVSFVGYTNKEIGASVNMGDIVLEERLSKLDETVIKGYYSTTNAMNTGNVSTVKAADIGKQPVSDPLMALQGRVPGLQITQTSGVPGASLKVRLRGRNSIANGNDPLYIVDGVPFAAPSKLAISSAANSDLSLFASLRPEDIERIEVLKDADATAIYGSRGANGVILITTKKGKAGKTKVDLNISSGIGKITRGLKQMNTAEYLEMRREAFKNDGTTPGSLDYDINGKWDTTRFTDWQKVMIGGTSRVTNTNASVSGGSNQTQFLLGGSYRKEGMVYPGDYANYTGGMNFNIRHRSEDQRFNIDISAGYSYNKNRMPIVDFAIYTTLAPNAPALYKADGELNWEDDTFDNPFRYLKQKNTSVTENLINNMMISYKFTSNLEIKTSLGYNSIQLKETSLTPLSSLNLSIENPFNDRINISGTSQRKSWIIEPQLVYNFSYGKHDLDAVVGTTFQQTTLDGMIQTGSGFSSDALLENLGAAVSLTTSVNKSLYRYNAVFARLGYNYDQKYILNLTGRRDGSSRFGPGRQFGNFGAIGAAWLFHKEQFIKKLLPFLSYGKIRASIGKTGNDQLADYAYLSSYYSSSSAYFGVTGLSPKQLTNPLYGWETINKLEAGVDVGVLDNRILLNISWYRNRTSNQLVGYPLPAITGFNKILANLPAVIENKGLELELNTVNIRRGSFSWTSGLNVTIPKNKLVSYPDLEKSSYRQIYAVGQPLSIQYVYQYTGIDPATGTYTFADLNKDGAITDDKDKMPLFIGQKYYGGFNNTISYKNLSLDVFIQFVKQTGYSYDSKTTPGVFYGNGLNQPASVLDRWRSTNQPGKYQRYTTKYEEVYAINDHYAVSDARIRDASYLRLKNIQLSWQLPAKWQTRLKTSACRLYVQAQNLLTLTGFNGADPENQEFLGNNILPPLKVFVAGLQITL